MSLPGSKSRYSLLFQNTFPVGPPDGNVASIFAVGKVASGDCNSGLSLPQIWVFVGPGMIMFMRISTSETSRAVTLDADQIAALAAL